MSLVLTEVVAMVCFGLGLKMPTLARVTIGCRCGVGELLGVEPNGVVEVVLVRVVSREDACVGEGGGVMLWSLGWIDAC